MGESNKCCEQFKRPILSDAKINLEIFIVLAEKRDLENQESTHRSKYMYYRLRTKGGNLKQTTGDRFYFFLELVFIHLFNK